MSLFSFYFHDLSIGESGVLKSPTIIVCGEIYFLSFSRVSFMNVGDFLFGANKLKIESSSWQISPVMSKKCPSQRSSKHSMEKGQPIQQMVLVQLALNMQKNENRPVLISLYKAQV